MKETTRFWDQMADPENLHARSEQQSLALALDLGELPLELLRRLALHFFLETNPQPSWRATPDLCRADTDGR